MDVYKHGDATPYLDEALVMRTAEAGGASKSRDIAYVLYLQAQNLHHLSKFSAAGKKYLEASKMLVDTMPNGDPLIGRCYCSQALNTAAQAKYLEAKAQAEKGYAILAKSCGTKRVETAEGFVSPHSHSDHARQRKGRACASPTGPELA